MNIFSRSTRQVVESQDSSASLEPAESFGLFELGRGKHSEDCVVELSFLDRGLAWYADYPSIVAVHGLGGHFWSTWEYNQSNIRKLWLEDFLIDQLRDAKISARVLSYGYDSASVFTKTVTSIDNEAERLLNKLDLKRDLEHEKRRPIILVAHSLGGLIVKKSMILAWERSSLHGVLLQSIRGIVFLGVPHRGADTAYWASLPANIIKYGSLGFRGSTEFLNSLEKNSESWRTISKQFVERGESLQIRTFFETKKIGNILIVDEDSARLNLPNERALGLSDSDHRTICKFSHANSERYEPVWKAIRDLAREITADFRQSPYQPSEEELEVLRDLYTSDYESHKNRNPKRTLGTCEWVFHHAEYISWVSNNTSSLLWVSADPGCGKSVLASFLVDKFKSSEFQVVLPSTVCFFFFKDDSDEQDNAISAISSILHQQFSATPELIKCALKQYKIKGKKLFGELRSLWNILMSAATDATLSTVICVIDGLDECQNPSRDELFQLLSEFCANSARKGEERTRLKILLLSRPYGFIEDALHHPLTIRMKMEDESDLTGADVELVIKNRVSRFGSKKKISDQVQKRLIDRLISFAGQTFLWVSLVLADLESSLRASEIKLEELISQIPKNLNDVYEKILGTSRSQKDAQRILYIILGAVRPLSLAEMNIAFVIKPEDRDYDDLDLEPEIEKTIRNLCGLFVKVIDSKIYLVHQTAREFLINNDDSCVGGLNKWQNSLDPLEADNILAQVCIFYIMLNVFEEEPLCIDDQSDFSRLVDRYIAKHDFIEYAATNWASHFRKVQSRATNLVIESVLKIFNTQSERFQTWFEIFVQSNDGSHYLFFEPFPTYTPLHMASYCGCEIIVRLLLKNGANINAYNSSKTTSLKLAISGRHTAVVNVLLEYDADVEIQSRFKRTALLEAAQWGYEPIVRSLLEKGANPNITGVFEQTALHVAAANGHESVVRLLIKTGTEADLAGYDGGTALHEAAEHGHGSVIKSPVEKGVSLDVQDEDRNTALHLAVRKYDLGHENTVKLLLQNHASVDIQNNDGRTALHEAVQDENQTTVKLLLENHASIDIQDVHGSTALHEAVENENQVMVKLLLENHASIDIQDNDGRTALHEAVRNENQIMIKFFLENHASVDIQDVYGRTVLHEAVRNENQAMIKLLLENHASIDIQDVYENAALHEAVRNENQAMVKLLLENHTSIDIQDVYGRTALHSAVTFVCESIIELLLEKGARHDIRDKYGSTPLDYADRWWWYPSVATLLRRYGARSALSET